ncbi:hypothetical protein, partial [Caulobacter sp. S45]|uniref:hypothetical protein n=1 Tax=Caulobacter sp. S45 TaxID=1641861 RepID=UPI001C2D19B4
MKRLMTAAVAVTLMCGVSAYAYAQDSQPATAGDSSAAAPAQGSMPSGSMSPDPAASPPQGTDQSGQAPQGPMNGASPPAGGDQSGGAMQG